MPQITQLNQRLSESPVEYASGGYTARAFFLRSLRFRVRPTSDHACLSHSLHPLVSITARAAGRRGLQARMHALFSAALTTSGISILGQGHRIATQMGIPLCYSFQERGPLPSCFFLSLDRWLVCMLSSVASRTLYSLFPFSIRCTAQDNLILAQTHPPFLFMLLPYSICVCIFLRLLRETWKLQ